MKKRIVLTDIALTTPLGTTVSGVWDSLLQKKSGLTGVRSFPLPGIGTNIAGELPFLIQSDHKWRSLLELLLSQLARQCAGDTFFSLATLFRGIEKYSFVTTLKEEVCRLTGCSPERIFYNSNTCASGNFALNTGANLIATGAAERVVCGGLDILSPYLFAGFESLRNLSKKGNRPFEAERDGLSLGEGGALLVLQSLESARKDDVPILCEFAGFGTSCDTKGVTGMDKTGKGVESCILDALNNARIDSREVDLISAHGTGTRLNDAVEALVFEKVFGPRPYIQAFKSYWGHCMGGSSAIEAALLALTFQKNVLIPLYNEGPFEKNLNFVTDCIDCSVEYALSTAFGFGGVNSCLVLKRFYD